jgi:hypothetical protein
MRVVSFLLPLVGRGRGGGREVMRTRHREFMPFRPPSLPSPARGEGCEAHPAIASSRRLVTGGPNTPITTKTIAIAPAMKPNTPIVP